MKRFTSIVLYLLLLCYLPTAAAQLKVEVIPLQHRTAAQIIPVLAPLVSEGGAVTGINNQLIIKTTPANLEELKQLLTGLDTPLHRLMITVRQDREGSAVRNGTSVSGGYSNGNVAISRSGSRRGKPGTSVGFSDEDGNNIRLHAGSEHSSISDNSDFRVQTVEGEPAWIQTGQSVPVTNRTTYINRNGVAVQDTTDYQDVTSGFYVIADLHGDRVTLSISPNMSRVNAHRGGAFDVQNIQTTVQGRLGEWIPIGGIDQSSSRDSNSIASGNSRRQQENRTVLLKVEEVN